MLGLLTGLGLLELWHLIYPRLLTLKSYGISGQIFSLISSFLSNRRLPVVLDGKSSQEYPVNTGVPQGSILGPTLFLLYINNLPDDVICDIAIYADDTTLFSRCDRVSDLWQQLELASELESDLRDTVDWGKKWLVDFNAGNTQLVLFDWSNNNDSIDVKMGGAPSCYLDLSDKLQKWICRIVGPSLATSLEPLAHRRNVASLSLFYRYYFGRCSSELAQLVPLPFFSGRSTRYSDRLHDFSVTIPRCYKDVYVNSFFPCTAKLWNSLPIECFPLTYDLSGFKFRINSYLLTVGSF